MTLKQGQGHQTWYELVDAKQGYNNAQSEIKVLSNQETDQLYPLNMCESKKEWHIHDLLDVLNNPTKFQLNQIRT